MTNAPAWLNAKIAEIHIDPSNPFAITRWQYRDQTVYYIPPAMPDGFGCLYDADGNGLGCPDGGMTGDGDGTYSDFFDVRTAEHLVWKPNR